MLKYGESSTPDWPSRILITIQAPCPLKRALHLVPVHNSVGGILKLCSGFTQDESA